MTNRLLDCYNFLGPLNIQAICSKSDSKFYFFEINARIGGSYILSVNSGLDLNQFILDYYMKKKSKKNSNYKRKFMVRFLEESYFNLEE